jgi:hypothetical protein
MAKKVKSKREKLQIEVEVPSKKIHVEHVFCPKGHQLISSEKTINGYPAIKMKVKKRDQEGIIYIDPVYGSFKNIEEGIKLHKGDVVGFYCPECGISLRAVGETCQLCSSPMFYASLPGGGIIELCSKKGCYYHKLKIVDAEQQIARLFENDTLESYL